MNEDHFSQTEKEKFKNNTQASVGVARDAIIRGVIAAGVDADLSRSSRPRW